MKPSFRLTPTASADLTYILEEIAEENPEAAHFVHERLLDAFRTLALSPGIGHFHDELLSRKYRFWNLYPYVIAYAWEPRPIQIISVIHGARDLATIFALRERDE